MLVYSVTETVDIASIVVLIYYSSIVVLEICLPPPPKLQSWLRETKLHIICTVVLTCRGELGRVDHMRTVSDISVFKERRKMLRS